MRWYQVIVVISTLFVQHVVWTESRAVSGEDPNEMEGEIVYPRVYHMSRKKRDVGSSDETRLIVIKADNTTFYLELKPNDNLVIDELDYNDTSDPCIFQGKILSHPGGMAAISTCEGGGNMNGLLITPEESLLLQPLSKFKPHHVLHPIEKDIVAHVLFKAEDGVEEFCGTDHLGNNTYHLVPEEENEIPKENSRVKRSEKAVYTIETAVFVDKYLYNRYSEHSPRRTSQYAREMVFTIMNQESVQSSEGDIDVYLDEWCTWQGKRTDRVWDHAVLLTGLDLFKIQNGNKNKKVLGLAWVNGMCRPKYSCTLNEGMNFEAAFVIAHEMGHCLSMLHDGTGNTCDDNTYIMSPKTGPGKTHWSSCSNKYLADFIKSGYAPCLEDGGKPISSDLDLQNPPSLPGERISVNEQCKLALGPEYKVYEKSSSPYNDICRELWCVKGLWATSAHPALEGSKCGRNKQCVQGYCQANSRGSFGKSLPPTTPKPGFWERLKENAKYYYDKVKTYIG